MRRFVGLLALLFFALPLGISVVGCGHGVTVTYCNGSGYGPTQGQVKTIVLASNLTATGESLNYGQIGTTLSATAADCVGAAVSVSKYTYATTDMTIADVNPTNGTVCGGTWNRNSGGGIADYSVCNPPAGTVTNHTAYITAAAAGATSNPIQVFIHAPVTGVVLGSGSTNCPPPATPFATGYDPATNCTVCDPVTNGTTVTASAYSPTGCLSQNTSGQLVARVYANGGTSPADNITCQVGHVSFALQGATNIATIDANGVATANQPGSALVTATVSNSSSAVNSGFFSTCPPVSIVLSAVNHAGANSINVALNTPQSFTATVLDQNNTALTGVALEFNSTLPVNFPANSGVVTPAYPGSATITAACIAPNCNSAPFSQIGYLGNGKPITSNGIVVTAAGTASDVLYMGSTGSQYIASEDFTTGQLGSPIKLSFAPNSMVISQDGSTIYMGSSGGLEVVSTASGAVSGIYQAIQGTVLAVAPNNAYAVVADPTRQTVSLVTNTGAVFSTFNGVGTRAQWTPDSNTLYVTTTAASGNQLLTYSTFVGWESTSADETYTDVAVTVPSYGAYFAGMTTEGRSYCSNTTLSSLGSPPTASNVFTPLAAQLTSAPTDRLTATTDGAHVLGVTATTPATLQDIAVAEPTQSAGGASTIAACPLPPNAVTPGYFSAAPTPHPLSTGVTATAITGVVPASNSTVAAVTYTGSGGILPLYAPAAGSFSNVTLSGGAATAPVAGVFSTDNLSFYAGTSGDNIVHIISIQGTAGTETGIITPALAGTNGGIATPNLIVSRARRATS